MAANSRKTVKDIAKHSAFIMYIKRYLNVKVDETFSIINNYDTTEINHAFVVGKNRIIKDSSSSKIEKVVPMRLILSIMPMRSFLKMFW